MQLHRGCECGIDGALVARQQYIYLLSDSARRFLNPAQMLGVIRTVRIEEYGNQLDTRNQRAEQAKPLTLHRGDEQIDTGEVAPGMAEASDEASVNRVDAACENNRNGRSSPLGGYDAQCAPSRDQHRHLAAHQIRRHFGQPVVMALGPAELDGDVLAVEVASLFQACAKACDVILPRLR